MFADDVQLYIECNVAEVELGIKKINDELRNVVQFGLDFGMELNAFKSKAIILSANSKLNKLKYSDISSIVINGTVIEWVSEVRHLGYQLNRTIASDSHVYHI